MYALNSLNQEETMNLKSKLNACAAMLAALFMLQSALAADVTQPIRPQLDASKITEAKARAAVEEIVKKEAEIKELIIEDQKALFTLGGKFENSRNVKVYMRAPDRLLIIQDLYNGNRTTILFDGKTNWLVDMTSEQELKKEQKASRSAINEAARNRVSYRKAVIEKLNVAGIFDEYITLYQFFFRPLLVADPATVILTADTAEEWVFTGALKFAQMQPDMSMEMHYNKSNGLCSKLQITGKNSLTTVTNDKITVNPAKPIEDKTLHYQPPAGVTFTDITDATIAGMKK